ILNPQSTMHLVSHDRVPDVSAVNSQMICAAGHRFKFKERSSQQPLEHCELRLRLLALLHHAPLWPLVGIAPDRRANRARISFDLSVYERDVSLLDQPFSEMLRQYR